MTQKITLLTVFCFVLLVHGSVYAQRKAKKTALENIHAMVIGSESETLAAIRQRAVNEAKIKALKEAGISESVNAYTDYFQSETKAEYEELFASDIFTNINGAVKDVEVIREKKSFTNNGFPKVDVWINCTVLKYKSERDLTFEFEVDGIKTYYTHADLLTYRIKPYKAGFLRSFVFTGNEAYQIFPNDYEGSFRLTADKIHKFPQKVDLTLETEKEKELHRAIFVFLKEDIPYTGAVSYKEILDWIFSIPPDQRNIKTRSFAVIRE
jgi:hypothetical protein